MKKSLPLIIVGGLLAAGAASYGLGVVAQREAALARPPVALPAPVTAPTTCVPPPVATPIPRKRRPRRYRRPLANQNLYNRPVY